MKYAFAFVVAMALLGCKGDPASSDNPPQSGDIQPLAVGNYWHYIRTSHSPYGDTLQTLEMMERIARDTLIGTETWYAMTYENYDPGHYFINRSDGLYGLDVNSVFTDIFKHVPYPASVGMKLVNRFEPYPFTDSLYLNAVNVPITTPAGSFSCLKFTRVRVIYGDSSFSEVYYAPNVGLIRTDTYQEDVFPYIHEVQELQDYRIK